MNDEKSDLKKNNETEQSSAAQPIETGKNFSSEKRVEEEKKISSSDSNQPFFIMTLEFEKGKFKKIKIFPDSDPNELAFNFCKENNLDFPSMKYLTSEIQSLLTQFNEHKSSFYSNLTSKNYLGDTSNNSIQEVDEENLLTEKTFEQKLSERDNNAKTDENPKKESNFIYSSLDSKEDFEQDKQSQDDQSNNIFIKEDIDNIDDDLLIDNQKSVKDIQKYQDKAVKNPTPIPTEEKLQEPLISQEEKELEKEPEKEPENAKKNLTPQPTIRSKKSNKDAEEEIFDHEIGTPSEEADKATSIIKKSTDFEPDEKTQFFKLEEEPSLGVSSKKNKSSIQSYRSNHSAVSIHSKKEKKEKADNVCSTSKKEEKKENETPQNSIKNERTKSRKSSLKQKNEAPSSIQSNKDASSKKGNSIQSKKSSNSKVSKGSKLSKPEPQKINVEDLEVYDSSSEENVIKIQEESKGNQEELDELVMQGSNNNLQSKLMSKPVVPEQSSEDAKTDENRRNAPPGKVITSETSANNFPKTFLISSDLLNEIIQKNEVETYQGMKTESQEPPDIAALLAIKKKKDEENKKLEEELKLEQMEEERKLKEKRELEEEDKREREEFLLYEQSRKNKKSNNNGKQKLLLEELEYNFPEESVNDSFDSNNSNSRRNYSLPNKIKSNLTSNNAKTSDLIAGKKSSKNPSISKSRKTYSNSNTNTFKQSSFSEDTNKDLSNYHQQITSATTSQMVTKNHSKPHQTPKKSMKESKQKLFRYQLEQSKRNKEKKANGNNLYSSQSSSSMTKKIQSHRQVSLIQPNTNMTRCNSVNVFEKLYNEAEINRQLPKRPCHFSSRIHNLSDFLEDAFMNSTSPNIRKEKRKNQNNTNYGEYLYLQGKIDGEIKRDKIRKHRHSLNQALKEMCKFKPKINEYKKTKTNSKRKKIEDNGCQKNSELNSSSIKSKEKKKNVKLLTKENLENPILKKKLQQIKKDIEKKYTFRPKINTNYNFSPGLSFMQRQEIYTNYYYSNHSNRNLNTSKNLKNQNKNSNSVSHIKAQNNTENNACSPKSRKRTKINLKYASREQKESKEKDPKKKKTTLNMFIKTSDREKKPNYFSTNNFFATKGTKPYLCQSYSNTNGNLSTEDNQRARNLSKIA